MSKNFKKMLSYYKPYRGIFWADMFFATVSAAVALAIPLVIRYVTYTLVYEDHCGCAVCNGGRGLL